MAPTDHEPSTPAEGSASENAVISPSVEPAPKRRRAAKKASAPAPAEASVDTATPIEEAAPAKKAAKRSRSRKAVQVQDPTDALTQDTSTVASTEAPATGEAVPADGVADEKPKKKAARKTAKKATAKKAKAAPSGSGDASSEDAEPEPVDAESRRDEAAVEGQSALDPTVTEAMTLAGPMHVDATVEEDEDEDGESIPAETTTDSAIEDASAAPTASFSPLFQAPDLTARRPRRAGRRASAPSGAPSTVPVTATSDPTEPRTHDDPTAAEIDTAAPEDSTIESLRGRRSNSRRGRGRAVDRVAGAQVEDAPAEDAAQTDPEDGQESDASTADGGDGSEGSSRGRSRSRRRGGRGRRGRSRDTDGESEDEQTDADSESSGSGEDASEDPKDGAQDAAEGAGTSDSDDEGGSASSRRRRRRRRSGSGEQDDPPGTVTRVRTSRARDEVTGVKGSTRLEAKKQRRREGREAGRRRTIITEAEFLARRESVDRVMLVRGRESRTQIAVLEDDVLVEHYVSRETTASMAGNVYLGRVQNVLPSMEAAFVDIGKGRNAVLYAGEVNWDAAGLEGNMPKRIENALSSGDTVLVQVTKDPIGHKGARLTSQISLPGRYLVLVPEGSMTGISRKLPDTERARLKAILKEVVPDSAGVIVRTAAEGASEEELRADVERLTATWDRIKEKADKAKAKKSGSGGAPVLLHGEPDLTVRVIRDIFNEDFSKLVVAGEKASREVADYIGDVAPDLADRIETWTGEQDVFAAHRVDEQIAKAMDRKVWLPSGGSLVIDRTEAMTVVDVNTGKFVGSGGNLEETVTKNNIEAAEEIVRQLRLRDIGGIIVIDFIDMVLESNRDLVVRRLLECLGRDRTKHQVAEVTSLGLVQMTRKRVGSGLIEVFSETCDHCNGRGIIVSTEPIDRSPDGGSAGGNGGSNGNGNGNGNAGGSGRTSRRGGRGATGGSSNGAGSSASAPSNAPERPAPTGPTAAQIAAAAHAAALKASTPGSEAEDVAEVAEVGAAEPVEVSEAEDGPVVDETVVPVLTDSDFATEIRPVETPAVEDVPDAEQRAFETPPETVVVPTRRKRGRVVAPAGRPGSTPDAAGSLEGGAV